MKKAIYALGMCGLVLSLAGCGTYGVGANTPVGGAGVGVTIGSPGPGYGPPSYLR